MHMLLVSNQRVQEMGGRVDDGAIVVDYSDLRNQSFLLDDTVDALQAVC